MASEDILAKRDKVQMEILALERSLGAESSTLDQLSSDSDSDNESDDGDTMADGAEKHDLEAERLRIQKKIEELENKLGADVAQVDAVEGSTDSSDEDNEKRKNGNALEEDDDDDDDDDEDDELDLPENLETCLQMNLVYQEVLKEKLVELEKFLSENKQQQKEIEAQLSGPGATNSARGLPPQKHFIGYFMKPYFKDKLTGLGPPANEESKARMSQGVKAVDELKIKRWESWQKTLLKSAVAKDTMRKTLKPKLSKLDYLSVKMSRSSDEDKEELKKQMNVIEEEIAEISALNEDQLFGDQYEEHDWEKIANIDFEQLRHADDLQRFWQNYLHPSINKDVWKKEEIDKLKIAAEKHKCCHWDKIAKSLGTNRTAFMCLQTYQRYISKTFKRTFWTKDEDDVLRELVEKMRIGSFIPYSQMSYFMMGRDGTQLQYRWVNVLDPSLKRGPWSKEEDELLRNAVAKYGTKEWWKIRHEVPGRTDNSCRDRYLDCLQEHVKKGFWSAEETELLKQKVEKYGVGKWSKIASEIPNRVDSQCLHKWSVLKKSQGTKRKMCDETAVKLKLRPRKRRKVIVKDISSSDDETFLEYVDSDAEPSLSKALARKEQEVPLKEYVQPEIKKWIPLYSPTRYGSVNTFWVSLIAPENSTDHRDLQSEKNASKADLKCPVQNTVLDQFGNIKQTYLHKNVTMLHSQAEDENAMILVPFKEVKKVIQWNATSGTNQKTNCSENLKKKPRHVQDACMTELFKQITPWIGNVILPVPVKETPLKADVVCKKANITLEKIPVLSFFMKTLQIETEGCKKVEKIILTKETKIQRLCSSLCAIRPAFDKEQKTVKNPTEQSPLLQPPKLQKSPQQSLMQTLTPAVLPHSNCTIVIPRIISGGLQPLLLNGQQMSSLPLSPPQNIAPIFTPQIQLTPPVLSKSPSTSSPTSSSSERSSKRARKPTEKGHALTREITDKRIKKEAKKMKTTPKKEIPVIALNPKLGRFILPKGQTQSVSVVQNSTPKPNNLAQCPRSPTYYISSQHLKPSSSFPVVTALPLSNVQGVPGVNLTTSAFNSISPEGSVNLTLNSKNSLVCSNSQNVSQASVKVQQKDSEVCRNASTPSSEISPSFAQDPSLSSNSKSKINVSVSPVGILRVSFSPPSNASSLPSVGTEQVKSNTTQRPHPSSVSVLNNSQLTVQKPVVVLKRMLPTRALKPALSSSHQSFLQPLSSLDPQIKELNEQVLSHLELPSESFQFNPFLAFPGQSSDVDDWLNGTNGISVPDLDVSLPYLPPCASNIHSLTALLKAKQSLLEASGRILPIEYENCLEEDEQVNALRKMIRDKLSANPAYRLLKARFLSCFTMPAFLATINPCEKSTLAGDDDEEGQDEEEHRGDNLQEPAQWSGINMNSNGAPARHFSQLRRRRKRIQRRIT